ncbi:MAG: DUF3810 domain-containing protein [Bacteroides sp.]|nr:DUF3810 domain-containing protein [Bacteroides sp.]
MDIKKVRNIRYITWGCLLAVVWAVQLIPGWGEGYARYIYPPVCRFLSFFSSWFPFPVGDLFIFLSILFVCLYPCYGAWKKHGWKKILRREAEYLVGVYVWFYLAWGLNYSQDSFYKRTGITYIPYSEEQFLAFCHHYIETLNSHWMVIGHPDKEGIRREIKKQYGLHGKELGIRVSAHSLPSNKEMLFSSFISKVGVLGYMGPFFCEYNLNKELLPVQFPATYAHELAHFLGISGEAEANFYAYQVCTRSQDQGIRFCGYFSILNYLLGNAYRLLDEESYKELFEAIRPEIIELARYKQAYWEQRYSPVIGSIQKWIYDLYLRGNKIESGRKNYSEVIGLLLSYEARQHTQTAAEENREHDSATEP